MQRILLLIALFAIGFTLHAEKPSAFQRVRAQAAASSSTTLSAESSGAKKASSTKPLSKEQQKQQQRKEKEQQARQQKKQEELAKRQAAKEKTQAAKDKELAKKQAEKDKAQAKREKELAKKQADKDKAQAEREKELAKRQTQKEKTFAEKAEELAKIQAEKDKAQAEREKELAKKQADKEKAQAEREKEQAKKQADKEKVLAKKQEEKEKTLAKKEAEKEKALEKKLETLPYDSVTMQKIVHVGDTKDTTLQNLYTLNSPMNDYMPYGFGKQLIFSSDRYRKPELISEEWSEKVYFAIRKGKDRWGKQKMNGYKWSSDNNTALVGVDDQYFYFYRSFWEDNGEIFRSLRAKKSAKGKPDKKKPWCVGRLHYYDDINTKYDETSVATVSSDTVFFVSNRSGNYDIYLQIRGKQPLPVTILNTPSTENDLHYIPSTRTLYFASDRPGGAGGFDIYETHFYADATCDEPQRITDSLVNTAYDERDFHPYNDSVIFFASDRPGGIGNLDIYEINIRTLGEKPIPESKEDSVETLRDELIEKLKELGLFPFKGEVQVGAYRYIKSVHAFYKRFPCIKSQDIKEVELLVDGKIRVHKYIINHIYDDVYEALEKQYEIEQMHCLPEEEFSDMPFIGCLDKEGNRFAIFWKRDEMESHNLYYIYKNGKIVWKSRKF